MTHTPVLNDPAIGRAVAVRLASSRLGAGLADALDALHPLVSFGIESLFVRVPEGIDPPVVLGNLVQRELGLRVHWLAARLDGRPVALLAKQLATLDLLAARPMLGLIEADGIAATRLSEAVEALRAMLRVDGPSLHGDTIVLEQAWNEPRRSDEMMALGLVARAGATRAREFARLGARLCEWFVLDEVEELAQAQRALEALAEERPRAGRLDGDVRSMAVIGRRVVPGDSLLSGLVAAGCAAIVLDLGHLGDESNWRDRLEDFIALH